jgi:acyl carrier protein
MQQSVYIHLFEKVQQLSEAVVILELPETLTFPVVLPEITSVQSKRPSAKKQSRAPEKAAQLPSRQSARSHVNVQELLKRSPVTTVDPRLQKLIADQLDVEQDQVVPTASLVEDLDADSLDLVEYFMNVEQLFSITISDEDAEQLMTVGGMHAYLSGRGVL